MTHLTVANLDSQFSVWPRNRQLPDGWRPTGFSGTKEQCLEQITTLWADIRPRPSEGTNDER
ncbi:MbtH family NRPS accessory protein [Streptomyces sp. Tue6028]|uniref:MbtH family NRPS accessory protein n=1 Tax=Streptomyces sp. Tue6028 TaxID=2036037 RepID=UPI003D728401